MFPKIVHRSLIILSTLFLAACGIGSIPLPVAPIPQITATSVPPTKTPLPTLTPTPTPSPTATATLTPTATLNVKATKTAVAYATETAISAQIKDELIKMGLPSEGNLGWVGNETESLSVDDYGSWDYRFIGDAKEYANFILKMDVTWTSKSGLAGCGVVFRAESPFLQNASHYKLFTIRLSGAPAWSILYYENGLYKANLLGRYLFNKAIDVKPGSTNSYYLVVNEDKMSLYANGKRMEAVSSNKLDKGYVAWFVSQESGETICTFNNAWIWELP